MSEETVPIEQLIERARRAQTAFAANPSQERFDQAALAVGWALMEPARNRELSELAVATTGLGKVEDKVRKNHRKTLGLLRDIRNVTTCGMMSDDPDTGITTYARPVGVVGAVVPATNPVATPVNNVINALKGGNAIILSPSPAGALVCARLLEHIHAQLGRIQLAAELVQMIPPPVTKAKTRRLMELADLVVVTGSQDNVRRACASGRPAIGVGTGNVPVIVDETADLESAAEKITASKTFDHATSCSSENAIIVVDSIRTAFLEALEAREGILLGEPEAKKLRATLFQDGKLNRSVIARDMSILVAEASLDPRFKSARFLLIKGRGIGPEFPESGEKLALVSTLYTASDFANAARMAGDLLDHVGAGHSVGLHSTRDDRAHFLAQSLPTCRVIVNQAHCFATGGAFDNAVPFSLSMGCGSWGRNAIDENLHWRHFINRTQIVRPIPQLKPGLSEIFAPYWSVAGK